MKNISSVQSSWQLSPSLPTRPSSFFPKKFYILKCLQVCLNLHVQNPHWLKAATSILQLSCLQQITYITEFWSCGSVWHSAGVTKVFQSYQGPSLKKNFIISECNAFVIIGSDPSINVVRHKYKHKAGHKTPWILKLWILEINCWAK